MEKFKNPLQIAHAKVSAAGLSAEYKRALEPVNNLNAISGIGEAGRLQIPVYPHEMRAVLAAAGGPLPEDALFMPPVFDNSVLGQLGATFIPGVTGTSVNLSKVTHEPEAIGENDQENESGVPKSISSTAFRISSRQIYSKQIFRQNESAIEGLPLKALQEAFTAKLQRYVFGVQAESAKIFQGMGYKVTSGASTAKAAVVPSVDDILAMIAEVDTAGCMGAKMGFVTNGNGARRLFKTDKDPAGNSLWNKGYIFDYPAFETRSVSGQAGSSSNGNLLIFGDWSQLVILQYGAYVLTVDPYTLADNNAVVYTLDGYFDVKGLWGSKATSLNDTTQEDNFAYGWATLPIV